MKKKILTVAIAIAALCGLPAMAQTENTQATQTQQCTKGQKGTCTKTNKKQAMAAREFRLKDAFDGIQLTDAQKAGLEAIKPARPEGQQKANRNDSTARVNRRQARRDYVKGVKNILTPDQYVVFLENIVVDNAQLPGDRPAHMRKGHSKAHAVKNDRKFDKTKQFSKAKTQKAKAAETK